MNFMFGIADRLYARKKRGIAHEDVDWKPQTEQGIIFKDSWYCFVPKIVTRNQAIGNGILPKEGKVTTYTISSINLIVPDVEETLGNLREIYNDALSRINDDMSKGKRISLLGVSLGNVISMRLASVLPGKNPRNLVSLVGSTRLGLSAWNSNLIGHIARQSGFGSAEEYERRVEEFSPINYLNGLNPRRIFSRFGSYDLAIPYAPEGKELKTSLERLETKFRDIRTYSFADHCSSIFLSSRAGIHSQ